MKKKKKPALGAFVTLDAGDVEKTIDIFNKYISNDGLSTHAESSSDVQSTNVAESYLCEDEDFEDIEPKTREEVCNLFEDIIEQYFPSVEIINQTIDSLYAKHKGEKIWDKAYDMWLNDEDDFETLDSIHEGVDDYVYMVSLEDIREGSIGNMDDDEIDAQERTFSNIERKLKASDSDIMAIKYDEGYYDYDPKYIDVDFEIKADRYGELYSKDGLIFYKEKAYPFLFFRNESDVDRYISLYNQEMGE